MTNILTAILAVFLQVGEWFGTAVNALTTMFWVPETGLTFLGVLAVSGLAFSVVFLIISLIQNFLHFRG